ncbi:addiction module protein [Rhodoplanes sp. TEM]|uniref:Addiction module protein n=1 Tax=Rhodoplanes tepidamans TaxID=200616 RepID=A0ABT5J6W5_RHOTP|nr:MULTISPECIES: addiction module protein [Rhodoplanes]MDC7785351.1 addiction module protein [Rhodoplanes tepidamans]MDC7984309.1 addiction module protein [Rhodoplanes sp. TEM]MDQ0353197.1 putative addiction module component (TIGR02574 family) [Rhodoplanes tepidamans]
MNESLRRQVFALTPEEKIDLAVELWDSIAQDDFPPIDDELKQELDRRLEEHRRDPSSARSWDEVREWLWSRRK